MIHRLPRLLWLILFASVLVRLAAALYLGNQVLPLPGTFDQVSYDMLARRVLDGHGFTVAAQWWPATRAGEPTAHWSFLYTGFLALVYGLVGYQPLVARLLQASIVGLLLPLGLYQLGRRTFGERVGLWAAALGAFYIYFIYYSATLMTEMFTILALIWLLVVTLDLAARPTGRRWVVFGLLIGLGALLRQVTLVAAPVLGLWLLWRHRSAATVGGLALAAGVALVLILPVTARNWQAFGRFVLLNTNNGYAFFFANHPVHGVNFQGILSEEGPGYTDLIPAELRPLDEAALNDALMDRAVDIIAENPVRYLLLSASRVEDYFKFWPSADSSTISNVSRVLSFALYLPFMLYGLWLSRRSAGAVMPLYLFLGAYTLIHLLSWALIRYRLPVDAVLMVFAGLACDRLFSPRLANLSWGDSSWPRSARPSSPNAGGGAGDRSRVARDLRSIASPVFTRPQNWGRVASAASREGASREGASREGASREGASREGAGREGASRKRAPIPRCPHPCHRPHRRRGRPDPGPAAGLRRAPGRRRPPDRQPDGHAVPRAYQHPGAHVGRGVGHAAGWHHHVTGAGCDGRCRDRARRRGRGRAAGPAHGGAAGPGPARAARRRIAWGAWRSRGRAGARWVVGDGGRCAGTRRAAAGARRGSRHPRHVAPLRLAAGAAAAGAAPDGRATGALGLGRVLRGAPGGLAVSAVAGVAGHWTSGRAGDIGWPGMSLVWAAP